MELNSQQERAIKSRDPINIIAAGPGSGKTSVLVKRVEYICTEGLAQAGRVVVLTYTNGAAHELATRFRALGIRPGFVGTLHGYCFRLLQKYGKMLGYRAGGISILNEEEAKRLIKATIERLKAKVSVTKVMAYNPAEVGADAREARMVWDEYQHLLKRNNMVDYDRILNCGYALLAMAGPREQEPCDELLVDEYQDASTMDLMVYQRIPAGAVFYVGDPDQSIFGWRGGGVSSLIDVPGFRLEQNYRSDVRICEAANRLITRNPGRLPKVIIPATDRQGAVEVRAFMESEHEAQWICGRVRALIGDGIPPEEIAVLARTNAIVDMIAARLAYEVPLRKDGSGDLPHDWSKAMLAIGVAIDPENTIRMREWLEFTGLCNATMFRAPTTPAGLVAWLIQHEISLHATDLIAQRIALLPQEEPTLADLLQDLWRHEDWNGAAERKGVTVSTIHAAKGREWDVVILAGCEEGNLPKLTKSADMEEERRIAFVAVTRARHTLYLTHCQNRTVRWGQSGPLVPSRFIDELL